MAVSDSKPCERTQWRHGVRGSVADSMAGQAVIRPWAWLKRNGYSVTMPSRRRAADAVLLITVLVAAFCYRFNTLGGAFGGFTNDQFGYLARARQIQTGDIPFRDFNDPGWFLTDYLSAALVRADLAPMRCYAPRELPCFTRVGMPPPAGQSASRRRLLWAAAAASLQTGASTLQRDVTGRPPVREVGVTPDGDG